MNIKKEIEKVLNSKDYNHVITGEEDVEYVSRLQSLVIASINLIQAASEAHMYVSHSSHTCFPINVREPDGTISQHRPRSNEGNAYDILGAAITTFTAEVKRVSK